MFSMKFRRFVLSALFTFFCGCWGRLVLELAEVLKFDLLHADRAINDGDIALGSGSIFFLNDTSVMGWVW